MYRWVGALLKNTGAETLHGAFVAAQPGSSPGGSTASGGAGGAEAEPGAAPITTFEVSLLDELVRRAPCLPRASSFSILAYAPHPQSARHAFLRALSARRSIVQDVGAAFPRFCRVFWWILDACQQHEDARAAQTVLILSETFHQLLPAPPRPGGADVVAVREEASTDGEATCAVEVTPDIVPEGAPLSTNEAAKPVAVDVIETTAPATPAPTFTRQYVQVSASAKLSQPRVSDALFLRSPRIAFAGFLAAPPHLAL